MSERMAELLEERRVAPSILSADFSKLGSQVDEVMAAGARVIHFDVMDGHFVPPISVGPLVATSIADRVHAAGGGLDVHLMIEAPERQIDAFAAAGADSITIHAEATPHANRVLTAIRELGCLAGVAINPATPVEAVAELRGYTDLVLCMTINPGWGGQKLLPVRTKDQPPGATRRRRDHRGRRRHRLNHGRADRRCRGIFIRGWIGRVRRRRPCGGVRGDRRRSQRCLRAHLGRGGTSCTFRCRPRATARPHSTKKLSGTPAEMGSQPRAISAPIASCHQALSAGSSPARLARRSHQRASAWRLPIATRVSVVIA